MNHLIAAMPKAELHIHLEGSIRPQTILQLAERHKRLDLLPGRDLSTLENWFVYQNFPHFGKVFSTIQTLLRSAEDFALAAYEMGADMAAQNIRYREVMVAPYTHTYLQKKGVTIDDILAGLEAGRQAAHAEFGVEMRWVFGFARGYCVTANGEYDLTPAERTLDYAVSGKRQGVVGLTVGGYEPACPANIFAPIFSAAKQEGLLSLPHAGETAGPDSIWQAVEALRADRIGHGVRAIEDVDLLAVLKERAIPLDINLTSNLALQVYDVIDAHPFPELDSLGLVLTVNSDDPALFNTTLSREYELLAQAFNYSANDIIRIARQAFVACGAEENVKHRLLAEFDQWTADC